MRKTRIFHSAFGFRCAKMCRFSNAVGSHSLSFCDTFWCLFCYMLLISAEVRHTSFKEAFKLNRNELF